VKRALVLAASPALTEKARRLGVTGCLENAVQTAIEEGAVTGGFSLGREGIVRLVDERVVVRARRVKAPGSGRKAWSLTAVERLHTRRAA
jgi:hypothetical protein